LRAMVQVDSQEQASTSTGSQDRERPTHRGVQEPRCHRVWRFPLRIRLALVESRELVVASVA